MGKTSWRDSLTKTSSPGVLEANFIEPAHDKQDFERSSLFQRLEARLRRIILDYWSLLLPLCILLKSSHVILVPDRNIFVLIIYFFLLWTKTGKAAARLLDTILTSVHLSRGGQQHLINRLVTIHSTLHLCLLIKLVKVVR